MELQIRGGEKGEICISLSMHFKCKYPACVAWGVGGGGLSVVSETRGGWGGGRDGPI